MTAAEAAATYTALGWRVFPCHSIVDGACSCGRPKCDSPGKHPATGRGSKDATVDHDRFNWTNRNVAIATGDGLHVIDVDETKAGSQLIQQENGAWLLVDARGNHVAELPPSRVHRTGSGGWHYFASVEGKLGNSSGGSKTRSLGPGIDTRGDGGHVVVPPSNHICGGSYEIVTDDNIAPMPAELLAILRPVRPAQAPATTARAIPSGYAAKALASECAEVAAESDGNRNNRLNIAALKMGQLVGAGLLERGTVEGDLLSAALSAGMADHAARATIRSGLEAGLLQPRQVPDRPKPTAPTRTAQAEPVADDDWQSALLVDQYGNPRACADNAIIILERHHEWRGCLKYDAFRSRIVWDRDAPKHGDVGLTPPRQGDIHQDHHAAYVRSWIGQTCRRPFALAHVHEAIEAVAHSRSEHPLQDYLNGLVWDGQPRVAYWLASYLGADETTYVDKVGRWWLVSAVARAMQPGCQVDHVLVLEGPQGAGKTECARILAGEYYLGDLPDVRDSKSAAEALAGAWIVEIGELDSIKGAAQTRVKVFLSQRKDSFRPAYGRVTVTRLRQCVFMASTNEDTYLQDPTGARRFWPVRVARLHREALVANRDQLWAEAVHLYRSGAQWHPQAGDLPELQAQQEQRYQSDEFEAVVAEWACTRLDGFEIREVLHDCLGLDRSRWDRPMQTRVGAVLHRLGYTWRKVSKGGVQVRVYVKGNLKVA